MPPSLRSWMLAVPLVSGLAVAGPAGAYDFYIDDFKVIKNGSLFFEDTFSDGNPPPSAPNFTNGQSASYGLTGAMGPETGGKLRLQTTDADAGQNNYLSQTATLKTNTDSADSVNGLKSSHTFSVSGLFDLVVPALVEDGYGVRLTDATGTNDANDVVGVRVKRDASGPVIEFQRRDFTAAGLPPIDSIPLESNHNQIMLTLTRASTQSNAISASFAYVDNGVAGATTTFAHTTDIFHGEQYTRAAFLASGPFCYGTAQGNITQLQLQAHLRITTSLRNQYGNIYIAALVGNQFYFKQGNDWLAWSGGAIPVYSSGPLIDQTVSVVDNLDLSGLSGTQVYVGYGLTDSDLLTTGSYNLVYTVQ